MVKLLEVNDLRVSFHTYAGVVQAVRGVSFHVDKGEVLGIVGESGCGKSVTAQAIMKLIPMPPGEILSGEITFDDMDLNAKTEQELESIRGKEIGMIFQDPMTSLNPTMKVGHQIVEGLVKHLGIPRHEAKFNAVRMLDRVHIPNPQRRYHQYPHELSGGMRQRVMIAMALACHPKLLIADEPTTALDVTIQAQTLDLMKDLKEEMGMSIILITHDLGVVAGTCDRVIVMYAGEVMETGTVEQIFYKPRHPYTQALLKAVPRLDLEKGQELSPIIGSPPNLLHPPSGCPFHPRCKFAMRACESHKPNLQEIQNNHQAACWLHHPHAEDSFRKFLEEQPKMSM
ncbi:MAG: oligopeptide transport system ATP-binding protein [Chlamydiales bacterium]|jgi:oligopeptide transport system ATP-binding protein